MTYSTVLIPILLTIIGIILTFIANRVHKLLDWRDSINIDVAVTGSKLDDVQDRVKEIPGTINTLREDILLSQKEGIKMFMEEIEPIKKKVDIIEWDVHKLKEHTKYKG